MSARVGVLVTHPIQYLAPWFARLAQHVNLDVVYARRQSARAQATAGFGVEFEWDTPLFDGYPHRWLDDGPALGALIRQGGFDAFLVFGWNKACYLRAIRACHANRVPVFIRGDSQLATPRPALLRAAKYPLYRALLPRLGKYLSVGMRNRDYLRHYGVRPQDILFVPHCVDDEYFARASSNALREGRAAAIRRRLGIGAQDHVLLFVGKLIAKKRPMDFVRACSLLSARAPGVRVHGVVVGDGPLRPELEQAARQQIAPVHFAGFQNQSALPEYYGASDVLVLPSSGEETWGLVVNEAQACGRPAVVSDAVGCAPDLIDDGETGLTYAVGDVEALVRALQHLHGLLAERRDDVSRALQRKVRDYSMRTATELALRGIGQPGGRERA